MLLWEGSTHQDNLDSHLLTSHQGHSVHPTSNQLLLHCLYHCLPWLETLALLPACSSASFPSLNHFRLFLPVPSVHKNRQLMTLSRKGQGIGTNTNTRHSPPPISLMCVLKLTVLMAFVVTKLKALQRNPAHLHGKEQGSPPVRSL